MYVLGADAAGDVVDAAGTAFLASLAAASSPFFFRSLCIILSTGLNCLTM